MTCCVISVLAMVCIAVILFQYGKMTDVRPLEKPETLPEVGFVIAMDEKSGLRVAEQIKAALKLREVTVVLGHNGTNVELPLYTRHLIDHGRNEHMQIGNRQMVGCLMSHVSIWRMIEDWAYVFEEDAYVPEYGHALVSRLLRDLRGLKWSVLMLQERSGLCEGSWFHVGEYAATCRDCTWFNTRGYVITRQGANILLGYLDPVVVQVDALIGLVNVYHKEFRMYWTRQDVAQGFSHPSLVQDNCIRCHVMTILIVLGLVVLVFAALGLYFFASWKGKSVSKYTCDC